MNNGCLNPYCECDPCRCERPCACGVAKVAYATDEVWDAGRQELRYTTTTTYRPSPTVPRTPSVAHEPGHDHAARRPPQEEIGDPADLLEASRDERARRSSVLQRREATGVGHTHGRAHTSVRTAAYSGHTIEIRTTYEVSIDGQPLEAHMEVSDDGNVHYHALPNYATSSAVDLIRQVIDRFPDDYPPLNEPGGADDGAR